MVLCQQGGQFWRCFWMPGAVATASGGRQEPWRLPWPRAQKTTCFTMFSRARSRKTMRFAMFSAPRARKTTRFARIPGPGVLWNKFHIQFSNSTVQDRAAVVVLATLARQNSRFNAVSKIKARVLRCFRAPDRGKPRVLRCFRGPGRGKPRVLHSFLGRPFCERNPRTNHCIGDARSRSRCGSGNIGAPKLAF